MEFLERHGTSDCIWKKGDTYPSYLLLDNEPGYLCRRIGMCTLIMLLVRSSSDPSLVYMIYANRWFTIFDLHKSTDVTRSNFVGKTLGDIIAMEAPTSMM